MVRDLLPTVGNPFVPLKCLLTSVYQCNATLKTFKRKFQILKCSISSDWWACPRKLDFISNQGAETQQQVMLRRKPNKKHVVLILILILILGHDLDPDLDPWSFPFWSKPRSKCLPGSVVLPVFANRGYRLIQYSSHHQISTIPYKRKSGDLILALYKEIWLKESMNKTFGKGDSLI